MLNFVFLGLIYSCGSIKSKNKIELQTKRKELAELFFEVGKTIGNTKIRKRGESYQVLITEKNLVEKLGVKIDKEDPPTDMLDTDEKRISFLRGFFEGKCSFSIKKRIIKISGKEQQLKKIKNLLELENINGRIYKNGRYFSLYIEGKNKCLVFKQKIDFLTKEKKEKLEKIVSGVYL